MPKQFSHQQWDALLTETIASIRELSTIKGGEYAGDFDRLANFRRNAAMLDLSMEQVWRVYAGKHWDSITQWIKDRSAGQDRPRSEPMLGRVDDLIVYGILLKAMMIEAEETEPKAVSLGAAAAILALAPKNELTCDHEWHKVDRHTDACVFCNSLRPHRSRS